MKNCLQLVAIVCLAVASTSAHCQQHDGDWAYTTDAQTVTILGYTGTGTALSVPTEIDGLPVTAIGTSALAGYKKVRSIIIPEGVTFIDNLAFSFCSQLASVQLPETLTKIGSSVFYACSLTHLEIPRNLAEIPANCFFSNASLTNIVIWSDSPVLGGSTFAACGGLLSVSFMGNAPAVNWDHSVFAGDDKATVYYLPGKSGWGAATFDGLPTKMWSSMPSITAQPRDVTTNALSAVTFSVVAVGTPPLSYQWSSNGVAIAGATQNALIITNVTQADLGSYSVYITNAFGSTVSSNATLSMYPHLVTQFAGAVAYWGRELTLYVTAWGTGPLTYQWLHNGAGLAGATNRAVQLTSPQMTDAGMYSVVVSSPLGSVTNAPAEVLVYPAGVSLGLYAGVTVSGAVGNPYIIQRNTDLTKTNSWADVVVLTLTQPDELWVDTSVNVVSPTNAPHYYRVLPGR